MASGRHISSRSSLFSHRFPTFYACYLLKSIQTPLSKMYDAPLHPHHGLYLTISQHIYREYPKSPSSHPVLHPLHPTAYYRLYDAYGRQHNGEIAQGASKTKHHRPWVMQMIVHGFPSRLVGTPPIPVICATTKYSIGCTTIRMGMATPL